MAPDARTPAPATAGPSLTHCPHCRGAVRPGAPWCTQCWTDLRPAPEPAAAPSPAPAAEPAAPVAEPRRRSTTGGWPCSACGHENPVELDACAACGTGFLAAVRSSAEPLLVLPGIGDVGKLSRGQRIGAGAVFALLVALVVLLIGIVLG